MDIVHTAKVYAGAMLEIAGEAGKLEQIESEMLAAADIITSDGNIWNFLISPRVSKAEKNRIMEKALKGQFSESMLSLVSILIRNDRILIIREIVAQYKLGLDALKNRIRVVLKSAQPLEKAQVDSIASILEEKMKGTCIMESSVDPELLGGIVLQFKDYFIDGSMKSLLRNIKSSLLEVKSRNWSAMYES